MPLNNFQQDTEISGSYQASLDSLPAPRTYEEASAALKTLSEEDTFMGRAAEAYAINKKTAKDTKRLSAEEANTLYPGMETPFRQEVAPSVAKYLYEKQAEKRKLEESVANGPQDAWSKTKYAGIGLWAHITDPVETGAAILGSVALGGLAGAGYLGETASTVSTASKLKKLADAGKISSAVARAGQASFGVRVGLSVAENVAGGVAMGAAQEAGKTLQASAMGRDYDISGGLHNMRDQLAYGAVFGVGLPIVGAAFRRLLGRGKIAINAIEEAELANNALSRRIQEMSPEAKTALIKTAVADASELRVTSARNLVDSLSQETSVSPEAFPGKFAYERTPLAGVIPAGKKFFVVADGANLETSARGFVSDAMGSGTHMTDNPGVANATAGRSMNEARGLIHEVTLSSDAKLFDLDTPFTAKTNKEALVFEDALKAAGDPTPSLSIADMTPKEIIDYLHDLGQTDAIEVYQKGLKDLGYEAVTSSGGYRNGVSHEAHNAVMLLDDTKLSSSKFYSPDTSVLRAPEETMLKAELQARSGIEGRLDIDPLKLSKFMEDADSVKFDQNIHSSAVERLNKEQFEMLDALAKQGDLDASEMAVYERLQNIDTTVKDERTLTKAALGCLTGIL